MVADTIMNAPLAARLAATILKSQPWFLIISSQEGDKSVRKDHDKKTYHHLSICNILFILFAGLSSRIFYRPNCKQKQFGSLYTLDFYSLASINY